MPNGNVARRLNPTAGVPRAGVGLGRGVWLGRSGAALGAGGAVLGAGGAVLGARAEAACAGWLGLLGLLGASVAGKRAASLSEGTRSIDVHSGMPLRQTSERSVSL